MRFGIGIEVLILEKSTRSRVAPVCQIFHSSLLRPNGSRLQQKTKNQRTPPERFRGTPQSERRARISGQDAERSESVGLNRQQSESRRLDATHVECGKKRAWQSPCAVPSGLHTQSAGCEVHKSKNPGRSPVSIYYNVADRCSFVKSGTRQTSRSRSLAAACSPPSAT